MLTCVWKDCWNKHEHEPSQECVVSKVRSVLLSLFRITFHIQAFKDISTNTVLFVLSGNLLPAPTFIQPLLPLPFFIPDPFVAFGPLSLNFWGSLIAVQGSCWLETWASAFFAQLCRRKDSEQFACLRFTSKYPRLGIWGQYQDDCQQSKRWTRQPLVIRH